MNNKSLRQESLGSKATYVKPESTVYEMEIESAVLSGSDTLNADAEGFGEEYPI